MAESKLWDDFDSNSGRETKPESDMWAEFDKSQPEAPRNLPGAASDVGKLIYDIPTQTMSGKSVGSLPTYREFNGELDSESTQNKEAVGSTPLPQPDNSHTLAWGVGVAVIVAVALLAWFKFKKTEAVSGVGAAAQSPIHEQAEIEPHDLRLGATKGNAMSQNQKLNMSSNTQLPYEWGSVVMWALSLFLWGLATARPTTSGGADRFALGVMMGLVFAVVGGLIVAAIKHFKRTPKPDSNTALASAKANDKWIYNGSLATAAFFIGMAVYFEKYGLLIDAVILVALGVGVKKGFGFALWLLAAYAFIATFLVVAFGFGNAMIYAIIFYAACRSIIAHRYVDGAEDIGNKPIPGSAHNTTSQLQDFSGSTKISHISSGQHTVQKAPAVAELTNIETPPTDAKPTMNNQPPVNAMPGIAIESSQQSMQEIEDRLYEQIAQEIETNAVDKAIWTKAFAQAGGDDKLTRVAYIKTRFEKLMAAENARLEAEQHEREEIARREQEQRDREREKSERTEKFRQRISLRELSKSESDEVKSLTVSDDSANFIARCSWGDLDFVTTLIKINPLFLLVRNGSGSTGLHMAVKNKHTDVAKFLAEEGALVNALNCNGDTPIDIAKKSGQADLAKFLQQFSVA